MYLRLSGDTAPIVFFGRASIRYPGSVQVRSTFEQTRVPGTCTISTVLLTLVRATVVDILPLVQYECFREAQRQPCTLLLYRTTGSSCVNVSSLLSEVLVVVPPTTMHSSHDEIIGA